MHLVSLLPEANEENAFWEKHPLGLKRAITELDPFHVKLSQVTFDLLDENDFKDKARIVFDIQPDGVILAPIFKSESIEFCNRLSMGKIPFVFVDGYIRETEFLSYTGEDIFQSGRVAGLLTDIITPADKDILIVNIVRNLKNVHHLNTRTQGFLSYFSKSRKRSGKIINVIISDPVPENIRKETGRALMKNPGIASIFVTGSKSYKIAGFVESDGMRNLNIIGYDLLEKNVAFLKSGTIKFLIGQRPEEQAYKGIKKLFEFLSQNKAPEKMEYLPIDIVTSENVNFFINHH
jgi:LacI family transcriptional regulator